MGIPRVVELAWLIGRSISSVSYKLSKLAASVAMSKARRARKKSGTSSRTNRRPWPANSATASPVWPCALCLNGLQDRAFDCGLMWVDDGFVVRFSKRLRGAAKESEATLAWLTSFDGQTLRLPKRFSPAPQLLKRHARQCIAPTL